MVIGPSLNINETIEWIIEASQSGEITPIAAINSLGKILRAKYIPQFKKILGHLFLIDLPLLDLTGWRFVSVKVLLQVLYEVKLVIPLKIDKTVIRIIQFPDGELQFDSLVQSVVNNTL